MNLNPIGIVESVFDEKFGTPRQANLVSAASGRIRILPPFNDRDAFSGLEDCSHLWIQFVFHKNRDNDWRPKVRPPRLGGNQSVGVFATRSPYRPNNLGLSVVAYSKMEQCGGELFLCYDGGDMIQGTPVVDIKPYVPYADCIAHATNTLAQNRPVTFPVEFSDAAAKKLEKLRDQNFHQLIIDVLSLDPRPQYHALNSERSYAVKLKGLDVQWHVEVGEFSGQKIIVDAII